jgi:glycosyltransferase involved in cell wall biosynthesis
MEQNSRQIAVLLATYNGARFLREQLESLFRQSCDDFHLFVRDDGSTDSTLKILADFMQLHPGRITLVSDGQPHCGAAQSFMRLLESVESDYYMFCDQDDFWHATKIEKTIAHMRDVESRACRDTVCTTPVVVSTDLRVVDENRDLIRESFNEDLRIDVFRKHPQMLCVRHVVTGCAMMLNRAARDVSLPMSPLATMHDEWVALCTQFHDGWVSVVDDVTIDYRQHGSNTLGADSAAKGFFRRAFSVKGWRAFCAAAKLLHKEFGLSYPRYLIYKILYSWL